MPYVKPTVHLSRIAGTALKTFTHGSLQTVTASVAQNTELRQPLQDSLAGRYRKAEKARFSHVLHNADASRQARATGAPVAGGARTDTPHHDLGLDKYLDAWHKHQRNVTKDWQHFQLARRVEWQPPGVAAAAPQDPQAVDAEQEQEEKPVAPPLQRSYTTSALDNFDKAFFHDELAEAAALEQVNNAIAQEMQRGKDSAAESVASKSVTTTPRDSDQRSVETPASSLSLGESSADVSSDSKAYTQQLVQLSIDKKYDEIPAVFQNMLRAGVQKPTPAAYHALLSSAIEITPGKHAKVPKALEVYSDMLRRRVLPDPATFSVLIGLLARRSSEASAMRRGLEERLARYGGLEEAGRFMFNSSQLEYTMLSEDSSLTNALKMFDRASSNAAGVVSPEACAALVVACAENGRLADMTRIHEYMTATSAEPEANVYPPMITALGRDGDLKGAVEMYDRYKQLAIANNAGENQMVRRDSEVYAALIQAYGSADRLKGGLKFLASIQSEITNPAELDELRGVVVLQALLPLALADTTFASAFDLVDSLTGPAWTSALTTVAVAAADSDKLEASVRAFDMLSSNAQETAEAASAILAMHVRNANVEAAEPFWRIIEAHPANAVFVEPTTMRAVALIGIGQAERGLRQSRRMFARIRDAEAETKQAETIEQIDEAIELMGNFLLNSNALMSPAAGVDLLRMMVENGSMVSPIVEHVVARFGAEQIVLLSPADTELLTRVQAGMILNETNTDIAGPARFACLLENIVSKSMMPTAQTETMIEQTLVNLNRDDLSRLWNSYRYPSTPVTFAPVPFSPVAVSYQQAPPFLTGKAAFDDSFDPYAARTDVKGSNAINDLLERSQGRRLNEALTKFRNMRRVGRVPRMFTYGKLIEAAAKEGNLALAHDILEMAKQDVPLDSRYRVVRFGWQQILDHMVAGCLTIGRRDLAARYHQDLLDMGSAPSANTYGLYITTLKENTKTFDEASEAVKIFLRAKAEGVEPTSFLYNALIGKLGKARRIDDCLFYFAEMRNNGVRPTSVTYGTVVNALCRVSDEKFAEEIFEEMESCANYKPRPAPYHSLMQFFLASSRDRSKVLAYYDRMRSQKIEPTVHTFKLLIDAHATLEPVDMAAAEGVLDQMKACGIEPEAVHYASLIHAKGCVQHDMEGARSLFDRVISEGQIRPQPCLYQAMFESLNANHAVSANFIESLLADMTHRNVEFTPYIANALIHGWSLEKNIAKAREAFERVRRDKREPSTYEAMVRAYLAAEDRNAARLVVREALNRGYPNAVASRIADLVS